MTRRRKPWKRPKDLPKGEMWPPDRGLHPIPESWKEEHTPGVDNLSDDPKQGYFSDGMSEDIITDLSKISGI